MKHEFTKFFDADLTKLVSEINAFANDDVFWSVGEGINNSPGNLTLHLIGNLNHYIGAKLGRSGYVRNRPVEFSSAPVPRSEIVDKIEQTRTVVIASIRDLSDNELGADYPNDDGDEKRSVAAELVRILTHFGYHLGPINYHRRLSSID